MARAHKPHYGDTVEIHYEKAEGEYSLFIRYKSEDEEYVYGTKLVGDGEGNKIAFPKVKMLYLEATSRKEAWDSQ